MDRYDRVPEIFNATLGFQDIFVVSLAARTDRRDAMSLMAAATGLRLTFVDGVRGADILEKALPPGRRNKNIQIVQENITSALILEDDLDWDVRVKEQFQTFASASQKMTQPLRNGPGDTLSSLYPPDAEAADQGPAALVMRDTSAVEPAQLSAYGDDWDVLWLGHTGGELPSDYATLKQNADRPPSSVLTLLIPDDETVPVPKHVKRHPWAKRTERFASLLAGVRRQPPGARRLLYQFGVEGLTDLWDISLRDFCEGVFLRGGRRRD
ncbi:unnamed protein product [Parascedosporium putredinis]|uniref:Uncharacterized protein n=1 Tax=Parascedosporium putredinis TaxID=1442378 RepID=A0A9P1GZS5_9PEZI|nr:unnamed protein product [Parascedosporium putredinis]CAI7991121.1 unnamed protein product [Parascedosporium putredinis]